MAIIEFFRQAWCRVMYGHLMVNLGNSSEETTLWQCARCERTEALRRLL